MFKWNVYLTFLQWSNNMTDSKQNYSNFTLLFPKFRPVQQSFPMDKVFLDAQKIQFFIFSDHFGQALHVFVKKKGRCLTSQSS